MGDHIRVLFSRSELGHLSLLSHARSDGRHQSSFFISSYSVFYPKTASSILSVFHLSLLLFSLFSFRNHQLGFKVSLFDQIESGLISNSKNPKKVSCKLQHRSVAKAKTLYGSNEKKINPSVNKHIQSFVHVVALEVF